MNIAGWVRLMRWHRLAGFWLLLWPTLCALWIASRGFPPVDILALFVVGAFLMRSFGCVVNDLQDRRFDGLVVRTMDRPLVSGAMSVPGAWVLMGCLALCVLGVWFALPAVTRFWALPGLVLTLVYPLCKRYTHFPQMVLGVAFGWGVPMAFSAVEAGVPLIGWFLFGLACLWPIVYDTIYAMVDRECDIKIGVKSTAIAWGAHDCLVIDVLYGIWWLGWIVLGFVEGYRMWYWLGLGMGCGVMLYLRPFWRTRDPASCLRAFVLTQWIGACVWFGLFLELGGVNEWLR